MNRSEDQRRVRDMNANPQNLEKKAVTVRDALRQAFESTHHDTLYICFVDTDGNEVTACVTVKREEVT